ncbi:hypothetical protein RB195_006602 [Necator americanus]|uniref:Uncharacterized protein n=1 Tax=Necator americanus TaxID=51031 RepID=A0ABR1BX79_NECAM
MVGVMVAPSLGLVGSPMPCGVIRVRAVRFFRWRCIELPSSSVHDYNKLGVVLSNCGPSKHIVVIIDNLDLT